MHWNAVRWIIIQWHNLNYYDHKYTKTHRNKLALNIRDRILQYHHNSSEYAKDKISNFVSMSSFNSITKKWKIAQSNPFWSTTKGDNLPDCTNNLPPTFHTRHSLSCSMMEGRVCCLATRLCYTSPCSWKPHSIPAGIRW